MNQTATKPGRCTQMAKRTAEGMLQELEYISGGVTDIEIDLRGVKLSIARLHELIKENEKALNEEDWFNS